MMPLDACKSSMVSNSGTILIALRPRGIDEAGLLQEQRDLQHVGHPLHIEMMHWGIASAPNRAWASAAAWKTANSPTVSSLYFTND